MRLNGEHLAMVRTLFLYHDVAGLGPSGGVHRLLQSRFVVHHWQFSATVLVYFGEFGFQNVSQDEGVRDGQASIQIKRRDDSFEGIDEKSALGAAAAAFLPFAEVKVLSNFQFARRAQESAGTDHMGPELGQLAFVILGKAAKEFLADHERQNGITQEFQLLIVVLESGNAFCGILGFRLTRIRRVREGFFEEVAVLKYVS